MTETTSAKYSIQLADEKGAFLGRLVGPDVDVTLSRDEWYQLYRDIGDAMPAMNALSAWQEKLASFKRNGKSV